MLCPPSPLNHAGLRQWLRWTLSIVSDSGGSFAGPLPSDDRWAGRRFHRRISFIASGHLALAIMHRVIGPLGPDQIFLLQAYLAHRGSL
jgi:hypothetical protein